MANNLFSKGMERGVAVAVVVKEHKIVQRKSEMLKRDSLAVRFKLKASL